MEFHNQAICQIHDLISSFVTMIIVSHHVRTVLTHDINERIGMNKLIVGILHTAYLKCILCCVIYWIFILKFQGLGRIASVHIKSSKSWIVPVLCRAPNELFDMDNTLILRCFCLFGTTVLSKSSESPQVQSCHLYLLPISWWFTYVVCK